MPTYIHHRARYDLSVRRVLRESPGAPASSFSLLSETIIMVYLHYASNKGGRNGRKQQLRCRMGFGISSQDSSSACRRHVRGQGVQLKGRLHSLRYPEAIRRRRGTGMMSDRKSDVIPRLPRSPSCEPGCASSPQIRSRPCTSIDHASIPKIGYKLPFFSDFHSFSPPQCRLFLETRHDQHGGPTEESIIRTSSTIRPPHRLGIHSASVGPPPIPMTRASAATLSAGASICQRFPVAVAYLPTYRDSLVFLSQHGRDRRNIRSVRGMHNQGVQDFSADLSRPSLGGVA